MSSALSRNKEESHYCGNGHDLDGRVISRQDHRQGEKRPSNQKWHAEPPGIQSKPVDQEAHGCDKAVFTMCTPGWYLQGSG